MQVSNQMLSLTGSLLSDPSNPPPPPEPIATTREASPSLSPQPMDVEPSAEEPLRSHADTNGHVQTYDAELQPQPAAAAAVEVIDERYLSARELKQKRKDEKKGKRDERKARKEEKVLEAVEAIGAGAMVGVKGKEEVVKRKANGAPDQMRKKRKENA